MKKEDLIKILAGNTAISRQQTGEIIECLMDTIKKHVADGEEVTLRGFGTFQNVWRNERNFHPAPNKPVIFIPGHYEVRVKFSNEVKDALK